MESIGVNSQYEVQKAVTASEARNYQAEKALFTLIFGFLLGTVPTLTGHFIRNISNICAQLTVSHLLLYKSSAFYGDWKGTTIGQPLTKYCLGSGSVSTHQYTYIKIILACL